MTSTSARRPDAVTQTYQHLLERISSGQVEPGSRLKESALAASLGVSRTPVREALRRLAADGLVEVHPNRGAQLVSYTPQEIDDMFSVRVTLEPQASALAVTRLAADEIEQLGALSEEMSAIVAGGHDLGLLEPLNRQFHDLLLEGSGNRTLVAAVGAVVRPAIVRRTFHRYSPAALARSMSHHSELVAAARVRDPEWAEAVMRAHLLAARHTAVLE